MADYRAPLEDMRFALEVFAGLPDLRSLPGYEDADPALVDQILEEAGKLAGEVIAPLNRSGDREASRLENGIVRTPEGFAEAYRAYLEAGWNSLSFDPAFGGQGLPLSLSFAATEIWNAANMSFGLCPLLTVGAVELLQVHGSEAQKAVYLPKLISGAWTGTMNLTEPQAGSDVGALKTRAWREGDHYRIVGQKIFITWGEHEMAENIVHMVLARLPDAPEGSRGVSLFLVPKFLPDERGNPGQRNDLRCVSLEHKLGILASPTCTMAFGDAGGAIGYLVGAENRGMEAMFTMMNNARLNVGLQGLAIAERAYQDALAYARERLQSRPLDGASKNPVAIIHHPDVRRMLATMKSQIAAIRALAYYAGGALDRARQHPDADVRTAAQARVDLLTPVVKAWSTDLGVEIASTAIQVYGGMGFIEETGVAQHYRDARIAPIYEGTNGIQALDLLLRKVVRDEGAALRAFLDEGRESFELLSAQEPLARLAPPLTAALASLEKTTQVLLSLAKEDLSKAAAGATPYLRQVATVAGGMMMAYGALAAQKRLEEGAAAQADLAARITLTEVYVANVLPQAEAAAVQVREGAESILALPLEAF